MLILTVLQALPFKNSWRTINSPPKSAQESELSSSEYDHRLLGLMQLFCPVPIYYRSTFELRFVANNVTS